MSKGTVYLLHFNQPINPSRPCRHYIGYCQSLSDRMRLHESGQGARLTAVAIERGITWRIARTWSGDRLLERRLKRRKNGPKLCPICQQKSGKRPF